MHTRRSSTHSDINQVSHRYNNSPDNEHMVARNMQRIEINIQEEIVRQVGYLQGKQVILVVEFLHLVAH